MDSLSIPRHSKPRQSLTSQQLADMERMTPEQLRALFLPNHLSPEERAKRSAKHAAIRMVRETRLARLKAIEAERKAIAAARKLKSPEPFVVRVDPIALVRNCHVRNRRCRHLDETTPTCWRYDVTLELTYGGSPKRCEECKQKKGAL